MESLRKTEGNRGNVFVENGHLKKESKSTSIKSQDVSIITNNIRKYINYFGEYMGNLMKPQQILCVSAQV